MTQIAAAFGEVRQVLCSGLAFFTPSAVHHGQAELLLVPSWPTPRILELAPAFWKKTLQKQDTRQRLAANVFRPVTLVDHAPTPLDAPFCERRGSG